MRFLNQRGDTIVEVLIAIAVIGSVLGTSYAIVNRNAKSYQQVNERTEAFKLLESQLETLRTTQPVSANSCFVNGISKSYNDTDCLFSSRFKVKLSGTAPLYTVTAEWDGINSVQENASIVYRVSQ